MFASLLTSTIWLETPATKVVWVTILLMKGRNQVVEASLPGLARMAGVTQRECEEAIKKFKEPDKYSRTKEHGGRRLTEVDGGWLVLNGEKYRDALGVDERREYNRQAQARYREAHPEKRARKKYPQAIFGAPKTLEEKLATNEPAAPRRRRGERRKNKAMMTVGTRAGRPEPCENREWVYLGGCGYLLRVIRGRGGEVVVQMRGKPDALDGEARAWTDKVSEEINGYDILIHRNGR